MRRFPLCRIRTGLFIVFLSAVAAACTTSADSRFFGKTQAPADNVLRYITGGEPQTLDPQVGTGQPEARIYMSLFDGLVEYHPKTMEPIPAIAESWQTSSDGTEYVFNLRKNAKFSDGTPITANDFVYSFRRALSPELAAPNAYLAYFIKYSEAYNSSASFVKGSDGNFLLKKDFAAGAAENTSGQTAAAPPVSIGTPTEFGNFLNAPERLIVKSDAAERAKQLEADPKLKAAVEGKELVAAKAEDMGVEAIDDYTLRIKLYQPAPYFIGLLAHQFFRVVPRHAIEKHGAAWTRPENIVTAGAFKLAAHKPYDYLKVVRDANYWDAANVKLDGIEFYPVDEATTMMNLYKAGSVDAIYNHTVPAAWLDEIRPKYKDEYLDHPEIAIEFYVMNIKNPPMDNLKVRQAFALAIDRNALANFRKTVKPLVDFSPEGIFPQYEEARKKVQARKKKELNISEEEWQRRIFDPEKARKLLTEAGYPVQGGKGSYSVPAFQKFIDDGSVQLTYNTSENHKAVAEFVQAQWKQNLGITVPLKNLEFRTYLPMLNKVEYKGFGRRGWVGDYMDPFTFLGLFYTEVNDGATGWTDKKYDAMLTEANNTSDPQKRFELMAEAEFYVMQQQVVIPLMTQATNWMKKPYVKGFYPNAGTLHAWKFVYIEPDPSKWDVNTENIMTEKNPRTYEQLQTLMAPQVAFEKSKPAPTAGAAETQSAQGK